MHHACQKLLLADSVSNNLGSYHHIATDTMISPTCRGPMLAPYLGAKTKAEAQDHCIPGASSDLFALT